MADNQFIVRKGLVSLDDSQITGSLSVTNAVTASFFTGSFSGDGTNLYNIPSSGVTGLNLDKIISGSVSASISPNNGFRINTDVYVDGTVTAKEIHIDYVTSSVLFQSGSTKFGDTNDDLHEFTGSVTITGSITLNGQAIGTGKLDETTFESFTSSYNTGSFTGSFFGDGSQLTGIDGFPFTGSAAISGSLTVDGNVNATSFTGSIQGTATTASYVNLTNVDGFTAYSSSVSSSINSVLDATTPITATINNTNSPFTITNQTIVIVDSTNGDVTINLPDLNTVVGTPNQRPIIIYKNDYSQNVVFVEPSGSQLVNGTTQDIIVSIQIGIVYNPTSAGWVTEGTSYQSLAELELFFVPRTETGSLSVSTASYVEYTNVANKPTLVSGSSQITYSGLTGVPSGIVSGSEQITYSGLTGVPSGIVSSSVQVTGFGFATTGSNGFNGNQSITGSLTVTGQVVAQTLNVQQVTSSIVFSSGSNIFGNNSGNTHQFTGSLQVSGSSHYVLGDLGIGTTSPQAGLQIEKYGSKFDGDVQYNQPSGNVFLSATGTVANQDNWIGIRGNYNSSSGTSNLLLQANYRDVNSQAGHYISSKATAFGVADFIIGKLVTSTSTSTPPTLVPQLTIVSSGAATFASSATATIFDSTSNAFRFSGNNALSLVSLNTQNVVKINAAGYWGAQLVGANDKGILVNNVGNVVIGTTSSGALLRPLNIVPATDIPQLYLVQSNNDAGGWMFRAAVDGHFRIISYQGSESPKLTVRYDTGNVGIGTDSPNTKLTINNGGASTSTNYQFKNLSIISGFIGGYTSSAIQSLIAGYDSTTYYGTDIGYFYDGTGYGLTFSTNATLNSNPPVERMRITSGGDLGIGTTTISWASTNRRVVEINGTNQVLIGIKVGDVQKGYHYHNGTNLYTENSHSGGDWYLAQVGAGNIISSTNGSERIRITSGGNIIVGYDQTTTTTIGRVFATNHASANRGASLFYGIDDGSKGGMLVYNVAAAVGALNSQYVTFETHEGGIRGGEVMRITSGGYLKASNTGTYAGATGPYHEIIQSANNTDLLLTRHTGTLPYGTEIQFTGASPNNTTNWFEYFQDSTAPRFIVFSNGGIHNYQANNLNLSDERTKKDIEPLESYWDKFKAIEIVKFKYKDQTHDDYNIGVIAQQVEAVAPEFVDVDGWDTKPKLDEEGNTIASEEEPLKSIYTADLHHATIKVLQECMSKIEEQQTQIESLKAEIQTLKQ